MATALTVYMSNAVSATLSTANKLYVTSGSPSTTQTYTTIGNNITGYGEIPAQGASSGWAATSTIGNPTGKGWFLDATTLESKAIIDGNWSGAVRLNAAQGSGNPQAGTLTGDIVLRAFRYSGGTYTQIVASVLATQALTTAFTTYSMPSTPGDVMTFATGDKLYIDLWFRCTINTNFNAAQGVRLNRQSTDTGTT